MIEKIRRWLGLPENYAKKYLKLIDQAYNKSEEQNND